LKINNNKMETQNQFSELTISVTKLLTKEEKKDNGIFITPLNIITKLMDSVLQFNDSNINKIDIKNILEPSCGTCEIINYCDKVFHGVNIDGIEYNNKIYEKIKDLTTFKNNVQLIKGDFMLYNNTNDVYKIYDLIVGNPPYFVFKKTDVPVKYREFCIGRPNIFGLFIVHSLSMLSNGGLLAFIVPKSFLNSLYYAPIRNYIKQTCTIINIIDFKEYNKFIDTDQPTFGLIIQKKHNEDDNNKNIDLDDISECEFSIKLNGNFVFALDLGRLKELLQGSTTLEKLNLKVRTGNIVWNEHKEELTDDDNQTLLIYNTNVSKNNTLEIKKFKNEKKGQYIKKEGRTEPTLVVNRGNGNSAYKLNYAIVETKNYLIENHLNEIYSPKKIDKKELITIYSKIIDSFKNPKTQEFIELFLGNNGLSKTELETIFPIYYEI